MEADQVKSSFTNLSLNDNKNGNHPPHQRIDIEQNTHTGSHRMQYKEYFSWFLAACAAVIVLLLIIILAILIYMIYSAPDSKLLIIGAINRYWPSSSSILARFKTVAIVSDNGLCSEIGRSVLLRGGNAVDALVAVAICIGAINGHSSGIGGGHLMVFYNRHHAKCSTIDARETAPISTNSQTYVENPKDAFLGYKSIGVPGEIAGLWKAYKHFGSGNINWQDLLRPTVDLLNNGYPTSPLMEKSLHARNEQVKHEPSMRKFFTNNNTGELYKEGEILRNPQLANTLKELAESKDPAEHFYRGEMAKTIADEMKEKGAYITLEDLKNYQAIIAEPLESYVLAFENEPLVMCGMGTPSSYPVTQLIVNVMAKMFPSVQNETIPYTSADYYHKLIEVQKFAFALRSQLGDAKFVAGANELIKNMTSTQLRDEIISKIGEKTLPTPEDYDLYKKMNGKTNDHGTSQITIIDGDGNAVSFTSSINNVFGAMVRSEKTGIIWNDQMDDFSIPGSKNFFGFEPSESNFVAPGKRPMSSMSPLIVYDNNTKNVRLSIGSSGGSKIISAVSQVLLQILLFNSTVKEAIDTPRLHNQFTPFSTQYENGFSETILENLRERGQNMTVMDFPLANVHAILRDPNTKILTANNDYRRAVYTYPTGY